MNRIKNCTTGFVTACAEQACHDICIAVVDPIPLIPDAVCDLCNSERFGALSSNLFSSNSVAKFDVDSFGAPGNRILGENVFFDGTALGSFNSVDAVALLPAGKIVISTTASGTLAGLSFLRSDLVRWDLNAHTAALHLRTSTLLTCVGLCTLDVDAVHILGNGDILLSTTSRVRVNSTGQLFERGSTIRFKPSNGSFTEEVDETRLDSRDVDGLALNPLNGHFLVSFTSDGWSGGGPRFEDEDIIELPYGVGGTFVPGYSMYFDASAEMVHSSGNLRDFDMP